MSIPRRPALLALVLVVAPFAAASCSRPGGAAAGAQAPAAAQAGATVSGVGVVAEVNGAPILMSELDQKASSRLARLRQEEYEIRRQALDELVGEKLVEAEARKRGISTDELLKREVADKSEALSPATVLSVYEQNKERFGSAPKEQSLARIREVLGQRAQAERRAAFENELRAGAKVAVRLDPPRVRVNVPEGAPASGPASAPVESLRTPCTADPSSATVPTTMLVPPTSTPRM